MYLERSYRRHPGLLEHSEKLEDDTQDIPVLSEKLEDDFPDYLYIVRS